MSAHYQNADRLMTQLQENGEATVPPMTLAQLVVAVEDLGLSPLSTFVIGRVFVSEDSRPL